MLNVTLACQFCGTMNKLDLSRLADGPKCAECQKPFLLDRPVKVDEANFTKTVLESDVPVLVDFYADWCGPCKMMAPILDEIAHEKQGAMLVAKVDTDASPEISRKYNIRSIPMFGRFEKGQLVKTVIGAVGREGLKNLAA